MLFICNQDFYGALNYISVLLWHWVGYVRFIMVRDGRANGGVGGGLLKRSWVQTMLVFYKIHCWYFDLLKVDPRVSTNPKINFFSLICLKILEYCQEATEILVFSGDFLQIGMNFKTIMRKIILGNIWE